MISSESSAAPIGATPSPLPDSATPLPEAQLRNGSITRLVSGILDDAQTLVRQQFDMLKAEIREDFSRSKQAAEFGATGIVLLTVGFLAGLGPRVFPSRAVSVLDVGLVGNHRPHLHWPWRCVRGDELCVAEPVQSASR
ncbi:MAG: phage holin family protein [Gemmataceae bacterium]